MKLKRKLILFLVWVITKLDPTVQVIVPGAVAVIAGNVQTISLEAPRQRDMFFVAAAGGVGWFGTGWWNVNWWHTNWWAEANATGPPMTLAPRSNNVVLIYLTTDTKNNRMPVRYVSYKSEQAVPVETRLTLTRGVVSAYISTGAHAVPVVEVEPL